MNNDDIVFVAVGVDFVGVVIEVGLAIAPTAAPVVGEPDVVAAVDFLRLCN